MRRVLILDQDYPSESNLYGDVFVHTRVKEYIREVEVKVVSFLKDGKDYVYEGIAVTHAATMEDVLGICREFKPDAIFIHFYNRALSAVVETCKVPVIVWVHGYEALGWYRRLFNFTPYGLLRSLPRIVPQNFKQMAGFRKLVQRSNRDGRIRFVFVSDWMKRIAQADSLSRIKNYSIIANPINHGLFAFQQKTPEIRKSILLIRPFTSRKYANDIAVAAILELSKRSFFGDLHFTIYGSGKYFGTLTAPLREFPNIELHETFVPNVEIPAIHRKAGILLCPTRQDAQGVSMCEAMSSGLVPVATDCTAIPEFVEDKKSGLLTSSPKGIADAIEYLYHNEAAFLSMSANAAASVRRKCDIAQITKQELSLIK
ncbi:MAG: glycosyltransferase family 4 protein [Bacteroidetes bacterium]|nr:glycosyltransferase family 4 protein [Bacteroidota bacterium]